MPKHHLITDICGGGKYGHQLKYLVKTDPNNSVPYLEKNSLEEVVGFILSLPADVLKRKPDYRKLPLDEIASLEQAITARLLFLRRAERDRQVNK